MKTILIVGTSTGIGEAAVKLLSSKGFQVLATTRDPSKADHLAKLENVKVVKLDILNYDDVKTVCAQLQKDYNIDIVLSNAGIGLAAPVEIESMENIKQLYDLNFFATVNVLKQFIAYFKAKKSGLFMVTSSVASIMAITLQSAYGSAKRALNSFCETLYYEMKPYNVGVKIILPGYTVTAFKTIINEIGEYNDIYMEQNKYLTDDFKYAAQPEETAECIFQACTDGKDQIHYPADKMAKKLIEEYNKMGVEQFKTFFSGLIFKNKDKA